MKAFCTFMLVVSTVLVGYTDVIRAQEDTSCPVIVRQALEAVGEVCASAGRNQACYGNLSLEAEFSQNGESQVFAAPGDIVNVSDLAALRLSGMNPATSEWGVALMRLQVNLPDTLPGQNVTVLLFGNVEVTPAYVPVELNAIGGADGTNVRGGPAEDGALVASLEAGTTLTVTGRSEDSTWLRVALPDSRNQGWLLAEQVELDGDAEALNVVRPGEPIYAPMQAFYFQSGIGDAPCAEAPDSGILIQSPAGLGQINVTINGVDIALGSTAFLEARPNGNLTIYIIEGEAQVSTYGVVRIVPAGAVIRIALDSDLRASGPPSNPEPYDSDDIALLPVIVLDRPITIAIPISFDDLDAVTAGSAPGAGFGESWYEVNFCIGNNADPFIVAGQVVHIGYGIGRWPTVEETAAAVAGQTASIAIDGTPLAVMNSDAHWQIDGQVDPGYGIIAEAIWVATSGTHTVVGAYTAGDTYTCTFTVE